jgi:CelD/BcsL family acetyltransferase involved in cellulose biosynthesis
VTDSTAPAAVAFSIERPDKAALEALWTGLEQQADISFYLSWAWIGAWIEEAGMPDWVLVGRAGGEPVCLGLLRRAIRRRHGFVRSRTLLLHETGNEEEDVIFIEYNGFLTRRGFARLELQAIAFLRERREQIGGFDEIRLGGIAEPAYRALEAAGLRMYVHAQKTSGFVDLAAVRNGGGDYLATLSANTRQQVRRAIRIYDARGPLTLQPAGTPAEALDFFEQLGVLHERAWSARGSGGAWRFPFLVAFHKRLIETCFEAGGVEIVRVSCGEEAIGYIHCLVRDGWVGSYLSGFAYEADNKVKPGLVSFTLYIEHLLNRDAQVFDFLAGDHRYKTSLGKPGPDLYWVDVQERRPQLLLEDALRRMKQRFERLRRPRSGGRG